LSIQDKINTIPYISLALSKDTHQALMRKMQPLAWHKPANIPRPFGSRELCTHLTQNNHALLELPFTLDFPLPRLM